MTSKFYGAIGLLSLVALSCGTSDDPPSGAGGAAGAGATGGGGGGGTGGSSVGPLSLAPGEVAEVEFVDGKAALQLETNQGDEQFVFVLTSLSFDDSSSLHSYSLSSELAEVPPTPKLAEGCSLTPEAWSEQTLPVEPPPSGGGVVLVGDERTVNVPVPSGTQPITVQALGVGQHTVVWGDVTPAHTAVIAPAVVQEFLEDFEQIILPRSRALFGVESDLDADGRIQLVFSPLTYQTAVAFFSSCDLKGGLGCSSHNQGEYLYLTPPNAIPPPYNTPNAIKEILAHELSHMVHYHRKVLKNSLPGWFESAYAIEGVGAFAQDVLGYQAGNLYVTLAGLEGIDSFSLADVTQDDMKYDAARDGELRGASYLFVRWLYDRAGGDLAHPDGTIENRGGPALLRSLLDASASVTTALPELVSASLPSLALDFWTTLAASNRELSGGSAPTNPCFAFLPVVSDPVTDRPRGANLFASFHGQQMSGPKLQPAFEADGQLRGGGAEFLRLDATLGAPVLGVTVSVDPAAMPRARVLRVR